MAVHAARQTCPFCAPQPVRIFYKSELVLGIWDGFPVSPGHALLVPKRHAATWFEVTAQEQGALFAGLEAARTEIERSFEPDGYNMGINMGAAAGQTVPHLHVHLIPRYEGDHSDPRGGVRWVLPEHADYWSKG